MNTDNIVNKFDGYGQLCQESKMATQFAHLLSNNYQNKMMKCSSYVCDIFAFIDSVNSILDRNKDSLDL